jgi:hypothetical protein
MLKKIILFFIFPAIVFAEFGLFSNQNSSSTPNWFGKNNNQDENIFIGYGTDKSLEKAKQNAIKDIVNSISTSVNSSVTNQKTQDGNKYSNQYKSTLKINSNATISGAKLIKSKKIDNIWYVKMLYNNSLIEDKFKEIIKPNTKNEKQNKYLANTELIKNLNSYLGKKLNYQLVRKNNIWNLRYKNHLEPLNQHTFYKLFSNQSNSNFIFKTNKKRYKEDDDMYFVVNTNKGGFLSLFSVEHNGKVGLILNNEYIKENFRLPSSDSEDIFYVTNPYNKSIKEMYIAIFSENEISLEMFENTSEYLLDETNYNFDKLIKLLDKYNFSSTIIKIKK